MKKIISFLGLLFIATAVFAQSFTLKTADKTPCTVTLNGDFIVIEETIMSYFVNTKKSTGLRCISYTACLYSSSLHWKDSYISSGTL